MTRTPGQNSVRAWFRWAFVAAVLVQLLMASGSIAMVSAVRVFVTGESLWSKGIYNALISLQHYADEGLEVDFHAFSSAIAIPQGASRARILLDQPSDDKAAIKNGLLQAENHPQDIDSLLRLLPFIWDAEAMASTIRVWRLGDVQLQRLAQLGTDIHNLRRTGAAISPEQINYWRTQIAEINRSVAPLAKEFSATLGSKARDLGRLLLVVNWLTAIALCLLYWFSIRKAMLASAQANNELEVERLRSGTTLAALGDGVITLDAQRHILYTNPAASRLLDRQAKDLLQQDIANVLPFAHALLTTSAPQSPSGEKPANPDDQVHWLPRRQSGQSDVAVRVSVTPLVQDQQPSGAVLVLHDVSQEQNYMRMLVWQQSHDLLTGLDNRPAFEKCMQQVLGKQQVSLLHLNLDHFKMINASYGHAAGDEILRQVCQQLRLALREQDVLARIGGDEFAVLLCNCHPHAAMQTAERLRTTVHDLNVRWHHHNLHTGVSIGVVHISHNQNADPQTLLGMADSACKHAKESGRNRITVYDPLNQVFQRHQGDMEWVQRLRSSLEENHFALYAQTVYPLKPQGKGLQGVHFEVLLRLCD
ncbi:MAG: diguanylate cyclase, partial [Comamonas sp.]|nr:diguanylate cyclase [Candidatus Comamonas equi]